MGVSQGGIGEGVVSGERGNGDKREEEREVATRVSAISCNTFFFSVITVLPFVNILSLHRLQRWFRFIYRKFLNPSIMFALILKCSLPIIPVLYLYTNTHISYLLLYLLQLQLQSL